jgi:hypothetical protein
MKHYWVVGGEYRDPDFRALIPGTERMVGPFDDERKARNEWIRLTYCRSGRHALQRRPWTVRTTY